MSTNWHRADFTADIVQFSKIYLKTLFMDVFYEKSAPNGRIYGYREIFFKCSINLFLEYCDLTKKGNCSKCFS